ncbi:hypothetical protein ACFXPA_47855 [Amycolatopsis sp. NPDC059090]|uniref:hypothetical protein n=1 Tax=Amycolatopsis sp. NPDC059090 TaxID=3346723 RepID=UPI00366CE7A5
MTLLLARCGTFERCGTSSTARAAGVVHLAAVELNESVRRHPVPAVAHPAALLDAYMIGAFGVSLCGAYARATCSN